MAFFPAHAGVLGTPSWGGLCQPLPIPRAAPLEPVSKIGSPNKEAKHKYAALSRNPRLRIATWNTKSLLVPGKQANIENALKTRDIHIAGLQETGVTGDAEYQLQDYHTIHTPGKPARSGGISIFVKRSIWKFHAGQRRNLQSGKSHTTPRGSKYSQSYHIERYSLFRPK